MANDNATVATVSDVTKKYSNKTVRLVVLAVLMVVAYTQLSFFVIQPIGAVPEGKTLLVTRLTKMQFVDSADAMCERLQGGVSLFCRMGAMSAVLDKATILMRMPYSSWLYHISTGGKEYN